MALGRWHGKPLADFTSARAAEAGAPDDIAKLRRGHARPWALAAHRAGFAGIFYRLREDPKRRKGIALFHDAGEHPPAVQPPAQQLPVGLRTEIGALFGGEFRGDPILK